MLQITNSVDHRFYSMESVTADTFRAEAAELLHRYRIASEGTLPLMVRFYVSDIANQEQQLLDLLGDFPGFYTVIGQTPCSGSRIALDAWHLSGVDPAALTNSGDAIAHARLLELEHYKLFFYRRKELESLGSEAQMTEEFTELAKALGPVGANIPDHVQRTWIYCRDIDNNYAGLVKGRRELFQTYHLTAATHYITSTGIEGMSNPYYRLVHMDSFALVGHAPEQIEYMHAPDYLSPTHLYNVTFERGTRIIFGNASLYLISGTASIDSLGRIVHPGNVQKQTRRMVENVQALLNNHNAELSDLRQAIVYVRDIADADIVRAELDELLPLGLPFLVLKAPVCRPGWLVEMEAIALNENGKPEFPALG